MLVRLQREYGQLVTSGAQIALVVFGFQMQSRIGWLGCLGIMAAISLAAWASAIKWRRAINDTPTSRIASAAQGYVELQGSGLPLGGLPLLSPRMALPCLWYRYTTEEKDSDGKWKVVGRGESEASFLVDDGSGPEARAVMEVMARAGLAHVHRRAENGGKGAAVKDGFRVARALGFTHAVQIDADGQHDLGDLPRFLEAVRAEPAALVGDAPPGVDDLRGHRDRQPLLARRRRRRRRDGARHGGPVGLVGASLACLPAGANRRARAGGRVRRRRLTVTFRP